MWYTLLRPIEFTLTRFLLNKVILLGIASFISYEALYFTSLASFRKHWYELFLELHVFLQATALVLLFFHHPNSRVYVGIALGIFLFDRLIYRVGVMSVTFPATAEVMEDGKTVRISAKFSAATKQYLPPVLMEKHYQRLASFGSCFRVCPIYGMGTHASSSSVHYIYRQHQESMPRMPNLNYS
jgi:hypothetical protein